MNILIISPFLPYPLHQGGKIRIFNIIKYLSERHKITLACLSDKKDIDFSPLKEYCREVICIERKPHLVHDFFVFLLSNKPFNYERFSSNKFIYALKELLQKQSFDFIQIEFSMMWQYADIFEGIPVVLDVHNIEYEIIRQIRNSCTNPLKKFLYAMEEKKLRRKEEQSWKKCSLCFTVSDKEGNVITSYLNSSGKLFTILNGVDLRWFDFLPKTNMGKQLLLIGGMDYQPNRDSLYYFIQEIFPLIQDRVPDVKVVIVGKGLHRVSNLVSVRGIEFHENVPDILPYFRKSDMLVVPLRLGAGTRIKILEAMAAGIPVVSTSKGCEGIEVTNGEHLLIADSPEAFADSALQLMTDRSLAEHLSKSARMLIEGKYSWEKIIGALEVSYSQLSGKFRKGKRTS